MAKSKDLVWGRITDADLGIDAEVFIANENGWFYTTDKDGALARQHETLAGLRTLLRETAQKKRRESTRVKVLVTLLGRDGDGGKPRAVLLTGLTRGGRRGGTDVLTKERDGRQDTGRLRSYATVYRVFTPDEVTAYTALLAAQEAANKAVSAFESTRRLAKNAQQLVEEAQAEVRARPPGKGWRVMPKPGEGIPVEKIVADAEAEEAEELADVDG